MDAIGIVGIFLVFLDTIFPVLPLPTADSTAEAPLSPYKFNEKVGQRLIYGDILLSPKQLKMGRLFGWNREQQQKSSFPSSSSSSSSSSSGSDQEKEGEDGRAASGNVLKHIAIRERHNNRWADNEIPFLFSTKFSERQKQAIREALSLLEANSCFRFVPRRLQKDFLYFDMREGCFSFVGKIGGRQLLSLAPGCLHDYIIWHEVMHALGLEHEHQRPDRDEYIEIQWENVEEGKEINFDKIKWADVDLYHSYDYHSLMHYDGTAFGRLNPGNRKPMTTMRPLQDGVHLSDNFELTQLDIEKLQILSNCDSNRLKLRPGGGQGSPNCKDKSTNCQSLAERGFCAEIRYVRLIRIQCQRTCGFCQKNGENKLQKIEQKMEEAKAGEGGGREEQKMEEEGKRPRESEEGQQGVDGHYTRWSYPSRGGKGAADGEEEEEEGEDTYYSL